MIHSRVKEKAAATSNLQKVFYSASTYEKKGVAMKTDGGNSGGSKWIPVAELRRSDDDPLATLWLHDLAPLFLKLAEWTLIFLLAYLGFSYSWVILLATLHYVKYKRERDGLSETVLAKMSSASSEKEVLSQSLKNFPSWVTFPDVDRVEWINDILKQVWPNIDKAFVTQFIVDFVEPEIKRILDRMKLESVSGLSVKKVEIGTVPARLGGIKVYSKNVGRDEIMLDAEVLYNGDARVLFTLQGVQAEIKEITFKAMARITLKPILGAFPFIGGFEFYFLAKPQLDYSLGGIGTLAEIPGANSIVKVIVEDQIRSRFVWPNRFHLYLPIALVKNESDKSYRLIKPAGVIEVKVFEARNLMKKDKHLGRSGSSDPYVILSIGERRVSFRDSYLAKTVNPVWDYASTPFVLEDYCGQQLRIEVFDYDNSTSDDFLGLKTIDLGHMVDRKTYDDWFHLENAKHGEIHVGSVWKEAVPIDGGGEDSFDSFESFVASIFVDSCKNLGGTSKTPYPKCLISRAQEDPQTTKIQNRTRNPRFEEGFLFSLKDLDTEQLKFELVDSKNDSKLGWLSFPLAFLKKSPRSEFFDMDWRLVDSVEGSIVLSAKLYGVKAC